MQDLANADTQKRPARTIEDLADATVNRERCSSDLLDQQSYCVPTRDALQQVPIIYVWAP